VIIYGWILRKAHVQYKIKVTNSLSKKTKLLALRIAASPSMCWEDLTCADLTWAIEHSTPQAASTPYGSWTSGASSETWTIETTSISYALSLWNQDRHQDREKQSSAWIWGQGSKIPLTEKHFHEQWTTYMMINQLSLDTCATLAYCTYICVTLKMELDENQVQFQMLGCDISSSHWGQR
jgi:hypothetical protein